MSASLLSYLRNITAGVALSSLTFFVVNNIIKIGIIFIDIVNIVIHTVSLYMSGRCWRSKRQCPCPPHYGQVGSSVMLGLVGDADVACSLTTHHRSWCSRYIQFNGILFSPSSRLSSVIALIASELLLWSLKYRLSSSRHPLAWSPVCSSASNCRLYTVNVVGDIVDMVNRQLCSLTLPMLIRLEHCRCPWH